MNKNRDSRERFKSLANIRVNKAIKTLKLIGNLSNKQHYEYDESDAKKIILALENEFKLLRSRFLNVKDNKASKFKID